MVLTHTHTFYSWDHGMSTITQNALVSEMQFRMLFHVQGKVKKLALHWNVERQHWQKLNGQRFDPDIYLG